MPRRLTDAEFMAAHTAATFGRWPWEIGALPKSQRDWLYRYMLDMADLRKEAMDGEGDVTDIDVDKMPGHEEGG